MNTELFTDNFKTEPYWWDAAPRPSIEKQDLPKIVDVAIIGSGYTGLNAAIQTARAGRSTLVLDKETVGWGCSSRNGGQTSNSLKPDYTSLAKRIGAEPAKEVLQEGLNALNYIDDLVNAEQLDCDWVKCGRFYGAHNARQFNFMVKEQARVDDLDYLKLPYHLIDPKDTHTEIGTDFYHGGKVFPDVGALHPGKYSLELLRVAQAAGANVISNCEVNSINKHNDGFLLGTANGQVQARDVVIATNGYSKKLFPWLSKRIIPIGSYIIATEEIAPQLMDELLPTRRVIVDTRSLVCYYRACPDGKRILYGGRVALNEGDPTKSAPLLHQQMCNVFPQLNHTKVSHTWMGFVAYTFDSMPHIGKQDGMYFAMGYCGSGVSLASYFGRKIGLQVVGDKDGDTALSNVQFQTRPYYNGKPWFLAPSIKYYQLRDRLPI